LIFNEELLARVNTFTATLNDDGRAMSGFSARTAEEPLVLQFDHHESLRLLGVDNEIAPA